MKSRLETLQGRVERAEQAKGFFMSLESRFMGIQPILIALIKTIDDSLNESQAKLPRKLPDAKRDLSLLLEEIRVILDEVEGEAKSLELKVDAMESLQRQIR